MYHGFVKVAAATPYVTPADCEANAKNIIDLIKTASENGAEIIVFPKLCVSGATCGDLFRHDVLLDACKKAVEEIAKATENTDVLVFVGTPAKIDGRLYNCTAVMQGGSVLDYFAHKGDGVYFSGANGSLSCEIRPVYTCASCGDLKVAVYDAGLDGDYILSSGVNLLIDPIAENETIGKAERRRMEKQYLSAKYCAGMVTASAGDGESTTDGAYAGHNLICENGKILKESNLFENGIIYSEIDVGFLSRERLSTIGLNGLEASYAECEFDLPQKERKIDREFARFPFVPADENELKARAELALNIQIAGLKTRIDRTKTKSLVVGVSGGLDSTLALIVATEASKKSEVKPKVIAVTMPCFGTTARTKNNSVALAGGLNAELREINIKNSVNSHFTDIGHSGTTYDVTYENAQARERTQVLMDVANMEGGMVIGTGDLSELALGWATYNGDHMSMYGVNSTVPKTFIRPLIAYYAERCSDELKSVIADVLDTPVSPELLPSDGKEMTQKTEDFVGPYELHDFFIYYMLRKGWNPKKIYAVAKQTFIGYQPEVILKWLKTFIRRFFTQQFKRSCMPDGATIGTVSFSPRTSLFMPSDASAKLWQNELEDIE